MRPIPNLRWFETTLQRLHEGRPLPRRVAVEDGALYRYEKQDIQSAVLLKATRYISGLHAGDVLLKLGFVQELGSLQRSLADFAEDAQFLATACILGELTPLHEEFLTSFWEEEPTLQDYSQNQRNRAEVPRKKILSYLARATNGGTPDHNTIAVGKYLSRFFSGYVHGAAPAIMDMFNPRTSQFDVTGLTNLSILKDHEYDFQNYLFRGVVLIVTVARVLEKQDILKEASDLFQALKPHYT